MAKIAITIATHGTFHATLDATRDSERHSKAALAGEIAAMYGGTGGYWLTYTKGILAIVHASLTTNMRNFMAVLDEATTNEEA
jgi:membrane protein required for beta-lactamase induction